MTVNSKAWSIILMISLIVILSSCQPATPQPIQALPTLYIIPSQTPVPIPSATVYQPTIEDVTITVRLENDQTTLPADTITTANIIAEVNVPEQISVDGLFINFQAFGGGSITQNNRIIENRFATATYVTGETANTANIELRATLDIPQLGRVIGTTTIELVRQSLQLDLSNRQLVVVNGTAQLTFNVTSDPPDIGGVYRIASTNPIYGDLFLNGSPIDFNTFINIDDTNILTYTLTDDSINGSDSFCISFADRTPQSQCSHLIWGNIGNELALQIAGTGLWAQQQIADLRIGLQANGIFINSVASICYEMLITPSSQATAPLQAWDTSLAFPPDECLAVPLDAGYNYLGYQPQREAWLIRWSILAPGLTQPVIHDMVIAAEQLTVIAGVTSLNLGADITLNLPDQSIDDFSAIALYSNVPIDEVNNVPAILRLYLPAAALPDGEISATAPLIVALDNEITTLSTLNWQTTPPAILYIGDPILQPNTEAEAILWYPVYFEINISRILVNRVIIN